MSSSSSPALNSIYDAENNTLTDLRDNHVYKTVTIGTQVWMAQNIDYLPEDTVGTKYGGLTICGGGESGTAIEGDCSVHGRLYERRVLIDSKGDGRVVCPDGWKVPSLGDWKILIDFLGGESIAGKKMKLNDNSMWGENMVHTNESGFSATLTGFFYFLGTFNQGVSSKYRQTSMLIYPVDGVEVKTKTIYTDEDSIKDDGFGPNYGISVRCIKK
ncbi:FISUMP domain-containing protein [uncultured Fibrobacter sp.]|uniref:FISUMP domain-containing protein n=1 Tax=uncultured Fibrobacter sp. TaxID=261512 RepID=UPI0025D75709|nr:FISUMP domain-containing protein [uncultured Fibrobacter sp.]